MINLFFPDRKSPRNENWNYQSSAWYYLTLTTKNQKNFFGELYGLQMTLSPAGAIAHVLWVEMKSHYPNIELGEFVIMPNHIHGLVFLSQDRDQISKLPEPALQENQAGRRKNHSLSTIIGSYKSAVSRYCNKLNLPMEWQDRFYDHIVRDQADFERITKYIQENPQNWATKKS